MPSENAGVLVFVDANRKADILALCRWESAGMLREPPERLAEGKFVATLAPGVHGHYVVGTTTQ